MAVAYIAAAGIGAPPAEPMPADDWLPAESGAAAQPGCRGCHIGHLVHRLRPGLQLPRRADARRVELPATRPRRHRVTGSLRRGLPWLTKHLWATLSVVGDDAEFVAGHIAGR